MVQSVHIGALCVRSVPCSMTLHAFYETQYDACFKPPGRLKPVSVKCVCNSLMSNFSHDNITIWFVPSGQIGLLHFLPFLLFVEHPPSNLNDDSTLKSLT